MDDLIEALKNAKGPSPDLNGRIYCAVNGLMFRSVSKDGSIHFEPDAQGTHTMVTPQPFTESIDKALTLLPDEWWGELSWAGTSKPNDRQWPILEVGSGNKRRKFQAATIPLTICLAALKFKS